MTNKSFLALMIVSSVFVVSTPSYALDTATQTKQEIANQAYLTNTKTRLMVDKTAGDLHQGSINDYNNIPGYSDLPRTAGVTPAQTASLINSCFPNKLADGYGYLIIDSTIVNKMVIADRRTIPGPLGLDEDSMTDEQIAASNKIVLVIPSFTSKRICEVGVTFPDLSDANALIDLLRHGSVAQVNSDVTRGDECKEYPNGGVHCLGSLGEIEVR